MPLAVAVIIPARDEVESIEAVLLELQECGLSQIIVADNGSRDGTAAAAAALGAEVVYEPRRGYGRACLAGMARLRQEIAIVVFMDADGSDDPGDLPRLIAPIERGDADLVIGSRLLTSEAARQLAPAQRLGDRFAAWVLRRLYGGADTDLGPFRAIGRAALSALGMRDPNYGWTIEMQIKAHRCRLRVAELPVNYRKRMAGRSKVSGSIKGTLSASAKILWSMLVYALRR
jgi:glycosyltransferase involved in cell wall biosynthesis